MRRLKSLGVISALATAVVLAVSLMPAASQQGGRETITVCDRGRDGFEKQIDVGRKGFSPGDYGVFTDPLRDPETGDRVGRDAGRFTFVKPAGTQDGWFMVEDTAMFSDGKITISGAGKFSEFEQGVTLAVTGGTGRYEQVRGSVTATDGTCAGQRGIVLSFNLTLQ